MVDSKYINQLKSTWKFLSFQVAKKQGDKKMKKEILIAIILLFCFNYISAQEIVQFSQNFSETFYQNDVEMVSVIVCTKEGRSEEVKSLLNSIENVRISFEINNFLGVDIPLVEWQNILDYTYVDYVVGSVPVEEELDVSAGGAGADDLYVVDSYIANNQGITGEDVLIGIIDTGVDVAHYDFRKSNGDTRVKYYMDQSTGEEYDEDYINSHIDDFPSHDTRGHGTWVAGIAGGDGSSSNGTYKGVAPESEFVIVDYHGSSNGIEEGIAYCINKASVLDKPMVINVSLGSKRGPRDGTSPYEQAVENYINNSNICIVKSAGNDGAAKRHMVNDYSQTFDFHVLAANQHVDEFFVIYIWYDESSDYSVTLTIPSSPSYGPYGPYASGEGTHGTDPPGYGYLTPDGGVAVSNNDYNDDPTSWFYNHFPDTDDKLIIIMIASWDSGHMITPNNTGGWKIELNGTGRWDAYAVYERKPPGASQDWSLSVTFPDAPYLWDGYTITEPGNAESVITVGALSSKTSWQNANGVTYTPYNPGWSTNQIPWWCSDGPIRGRPTYDKVKPEIYASGSWICSALSQHMSPIPSNELRPYGETEYRYSDGTSASAPHMTGAVALYLQDHPIAPPNEIRNRINSCPDYGNSKYLDAPAFLGISYPILPEEEYFENSVSWNYPNPFTNSTTISFSIPHREAKNEEIKIYNLKGQLVKQVSIDNHQSSIEWDGKDKNGKELLNGIYLYQLVNDNKIIDTKKMLLLR